MMAPLLMVLNIVIATFCDKLDTFHSVIEEASSGICLWIWLFKQGYERENFTIWWSLEREIIPQLFHDWCMVSYVCMVNSRCKCWDYPRPRNLLLLKRCTARQHFVKLVISLLRSCAISLWRKVYAHCRVMPSFMKSAAEYTDHCIVFTVGLKPGWSSSENSICALQITEPRRMLIGTASWPLRSCLQPPPWKTKLIPCLSASPIWRDTIQRLSPGRWDTPSNM